MELRLPPDVVVATELSLRSARLAAMTPLGLEAWLLRLSTIVVRHDQPLFEFSPVA
jgi:hypothetical protein